MIFLIPDRQNLTTVFVYQIPRGMKKLILPAILSLFVGQQSMAVTCTDCTGPTGSCISYGSSCCPPCNGGIVIQSCSKGQYGTYPNCTNCPAGPNGETTTTNISGATSVSGCFIAVGTDFEDSTGYGEYVSPCYYPF